MPLQGGTKRDEFGLKPIERRFCDEYLIDLDTVRAARAAGYKTAKNTKRRVYELMQRPELQDYLKSQSRARSERLSLTADSVLRELAKLGFANIRDFLTFTADGTATFDLQRMTREQAAAICELTVEEVLDKDKARVRRTKIKLADKRGALELIGKHLAMFNTARPAAAAESAVPLAAAEARQMSDEELDARLQAIATERLGRANAPAGKAAQN